MASPSTFPGMKENPHLAKWVQEMVALCKPDKIVWCDGTEDEKRRFTEEALAKGILEEIGRAHV
jgi:GTP-dependent phosphoenolpyruvate carboxykinase